MDLPKTTAFVSGANRGLGKHLADQFPSRVLASTVGPAIDNSTGVIPVPWTSLIPPQRPAAAAAAPDTTLEEEVS